MKDILPLWDRAHRDPIEGLGMWKVFSKRL